MSLRTLQLLSRLRPFALPALLAGALALQVEMARWWLARNPLPNGYQNEILHLSNALDLWVVLSFQNWPAVHDFLFQGYWPPLHYLSALLLVAVSGTHRDVFVASNYFFLALLVASTWGLGRRVFSPAVGAVAALLVLFFPSIFGNLVRFEPNVALTSLVTASCLALALSRDWTHRGWSLTFGALSAAGLLVDRLAFGFFGIGPALLTFWRGVGPGATPVRRRAALVNVALATGVLLALAGYYHYNFFTLHREEILSQAAQGEIIETGELTEHRDPLSVASLVFYPATLLDSQIGPALGLALLPALLIGARIAWRTAARRLLLAWMLGAWLVLTLIQKKQVFYSIPVLPAVALLSAAGLMSIPWRGVQRALLGGVALLALNQFAALHLGESLLPRQVTLGGGAVPRTVDLSPLAGVSFLPTSWVEPRYTQARPPDDVDLRLEELVRTVEAQRAGLPVFRVGVFSEDSTLFEGYLTFWVRSANPWIRVNGLIGNTQGFYEWARSMDLFIYVTPSPWRSWPTSTSVDSTLMDFHRFEGELPVGELLVELEDRFTQVSRLDLPTGARIFVYAPRPTVAPSPEK